MGKITPFLWFDTEAEEAATLYTSLFPNSTILAVTRYGAAGPGPEGSVMTVSFELDGQRFVALNGGPALHVHARPSRSSSTARRRRRSTRYWTRSPTAGRRARAAG